MMNRGNAGAGFHIMVLLVVFAWCVSTVRGQGTGECCSWFRYSGSQLEFYDLPTEHWLPARIDPETGDIEFYSDGEWWPTGCTATDLTECGLSPDGGGSGHCREYARRELDRTEALVRARQRSERYRRITIGTSKPYMYVTQTPSLGYCGDIPPADIPEWRTMWGASGRYAKDDFDVVSGTSGSFETRTRSQSVWMTAVHDRFGVDIEATYDRVTPLGPFGDMPFDRLSLNALCAYRLLEQPADGFDLDALCSLGASRTWYEAHLNLDDTAHVSAFGGLGLGRTFPFGDLRLTYFYGAFKNVSGDEEVTGKGTVPMHSAGLRWTAPVAKNVMMTLGVDWVHTCDLPSIYDSNEFWGTGGIRWRFAGNWLLSLDADRSFTNDNQRSWSARGGVIYEW